MPYVKIDGNRALTHAQLVYGNCRVVCKFYPADNAAGRSLEAAYRRAGSAHLAEVQSHPSAEFGHLGKVVYRTVYAFKRIGNGVYKAGRKLVVGLTRI